MTRSSLPAAIGIMRYEFMMQVRRKSLWIATGATIVLLISWTPHLWSYQSGIPLSQVMADWALITNRFLPVAFGILLADRLPRDRRLHVSELLDSTVAPGSSLLIGKYAGSALATATPIFLFYLSGVISTLVHAHDPMVIPFALAAFAAIILPGLLFVAAFSIAVPAVLWVPLYQFLFVVYWFWGNMFAPEYRIPTLSDTILTPMGGTAATGFFGTYPLFDHPHMGGMPMAWQGVLSIALLLTCAAIALFTANTYLNWSRAHA
jgi:ABC-2 type transport system permease protein